MLVTSFVVVDVFVDGDMDWVGFGDGDLDLLLDLNGVRLLDFIGDGLLNGVGDWLLDNLGHDLKKSLRLVLFSREHDLWVTRRSTQ